MNRLGWAAAAAVLAACGGKPAAAPAAQFAWTKGAVCYEVFVRSFADSDGDGIGDLNGLTSRLDYVNDGDSTTTADLGATCLWLMPIAESPSYHGYDVTDYYRVEPDFGTADDFKRLVAEAHRRGIKVVLDMVLNHTSDEHPAFQAAVADTASPYRRWYRFAPTPPDQGPWGRDAWWRSPVRDEYYYGPFWKGMPDLDYANPAVREEAMKVADYWLGEMGADGLRLDALQYLVEEGDCRNNCPGTHQFFREYAAHIADRSPGAFTVGEVWTAIDTMLTYYPDELSSYFIFPAADSMIAAVRRGELGGMLEPFLRLQDALPAYRYSTLLSNHDGTRVVTKLGGDRAAAPLAATLLLTLPGLPWLYYGEEIGMTGDKPDERLRTPMQWSAEPGGGFTTGTPWEAFQDDSATVTVAAQTGDPASLLSRYRRLIRLRGRSDALAAGRLVPIAGSSPGVAAYLRVAETQIVLVVANLGPAADPGLAVTIPPGVLSPGDYDATELVDGRAVAGVTIGTAEAAYRPLAGGLGPREAVVLELKRR
ncbi:MAG: alpha-amylase family glycosyl hydrolase [Gemmatimonadales bacterium]